MSKEMSRSNVGKRFSIIMIQHKILRQFLLTLAIKFKYITFTPRRITTFGYGNFKENNNEVENNVNNCIHYVFAFDYWMRKE